MAIDPKHSRELNGWGHLIVSLVVLIGSFVLMGWANLSASEEQFIIYGDGLVLLGWFGAAITKNVASTKK